MFAKFPMIISLLTFDKVNKGTHKTLLKGNSPAIATSPLGVTENLMDFIYSISPSFLAMYELGSVFGAPKDPACCQCEYRRKKFTNKKHKIYDLFPLTEIYWIKNGSNLSYTNLKNENLLLTLKNNNNKLNVKTLDRAQ